MKNKIVFNIEDAKAVLGLNTATSAVATEEKTFDGVETKAANDVMHTQNTGHGAELVPQEEFARSIIDETLKASPLLSALPGFHGINLNGVLKVPVIGDFGYMQNAPEYTATNGNLNYNYSLPNTAMVTLIPEKLIMTIPVSYELLERGINIEQYIRSGVANSWSRTIESILLNADNTTGTNNINSKGEDIQDGDKRHWFRNAGLRKKAMEQDATLDIGTIDDKDLFDVVAKLGEKSANPADCLFIMNRRTALTISQLPAYKNQYQNGRSSTMHKGAETNMLGSDIMVTREMVETDETGAVSKTASENTKGSFLYINKYAPQYGFDKVRIEVKKIEGYGYHFVVTGYFAHQIASKLVGVKDPSLALAYNVTL